MTDFLRSEPPEPLSSSVHEERKKKSRSTLRRRAPKNGAPQTPKDGHSGGSGGSRPRIPWWRLYPTKPSSWVDRRRVAQLRAVLERLPPLGDDLGHTAEAIATVVGCSPRTAASWCALPRRHVRDWWARWGETVIGPFGWAQLIELAVALRAEAEKETP